MASQRPSQRLLSLFLLRSSTSIGRTAPRRLSPPPRAPFGTSTSLRQGQGQEIVSAPAVKKPVGAFRGGLFGFLFGATASGAGMYYYVVDEYRVSNQLLTEDIYALQAAVQRIEGYVRTLEEKVGAKKR